ncbi:MAG: ATP-dependent DNA helicase RecG [Vicinamibacteraceae bacterium]
MSRAAALTRPLASLKGVGDRRAADLASAGLQTIEDLLVRFPLRYEDRGHPKPLVELAPGRICSAIGTVVSATIKRTRRPGFSVFEVALRDRTGTARAVWFNQRFLKDVLHAGQTLALFGKVEQGVGGLQFASPQYEILADEPLAGGWLGAAGQEGADDEPHVDPLPATDEPLGIVPIYERIGTLTPKLQRGLVAQALATLPADLPDELPDAVRRRLDLPSRRDALVAVHQPAPGADVDALNKARSPGHMRLIFEEFFAFQTGVLLRRRARLAERKPHTYRVDDALREKTRALLPFALTPGQKIAVRDIVADLQKSEPMNRLLQGDVGSGKTLVATLAALVALESGLQVAIMAPTEILAEQHVRTLSRFFATTRYGVALLTGRTGGVERRERLANIANGTIPLVVGTHALVQETVQFARLGLVVVDEQHRFGVVQRADLRKKGAMPDVLVMTATPIPRTLALTTYGELDVTVMRDRPPGRSPIATTVRPESRRDDVWTFVRGELAAGRQGYVIYPLVEESEKIDVRDATAMADHLSQTVFPEWPVGLLHGRLTPDAKQRVMDAFTSGALRLLVATTVVEVGVDVPNATVIVVEHAERFGLSQLHQLRGRVGRGTEQGHCVLLYQSPLTDEARARLKAIADSGDGFALAEQDLILRGPGDVFGTRQAGMPTLRIGDLVRDAAILARARDEASTWLDEAPPDDPTLAGIRAGWADRFGLVHVG